MNGKRKIVERLDELKALVEQDRNWVSEIDVRTVSQMALLDLAGIVGDLAEEVRLTRLPLDDADNAKAQEALNDLIRVERELQIRIEAARRAAA